MESMRSAVGGNGEEEVGGTVEEARAEATAVEGTGAEATAAAMAALQAERAAVEAAAEAGCTEPRRPQRAGYGRRQSHCPCSRQ